MNGTAVTMVWDPLVRLLHWLLVASFALAYLTQEQGYELHLLTGYAVLAVVLLRTVWGWCGSIHARFADFVHPPAAVLAHLCEMFRGRVQRHLGHNPAGGAMTLALLACLAAIALSGIALDAAENRAGPLKQFTLFYYTDLIAAVHVWTTHLAVALIALHVLGVAYASIAQRENLVRAMVTGRKRIID